jgi:hypothetical protein
MVQVDQDDAVDTRIATISPTFAFQSVCGSKWKADESPKQSERYPNGVIRISARPPNWKVGAARTFPSEQFHRATVLDHTSFFEKNHSFYAKHRREAMSNDYDRTARKEPS